MATENKNLSQFNKATLPNVTDCAFGIVVSNWNENITENLYKGALETLLSCDVSKENIFKIDVPGSFELIYGAAKLMKDKPFLDAIIVIGCVIEGETKHFDFVCQGVTQGIAQLNTLGEIPIIFCVLTDQNMQQSIDRSGGRLGNKGVEAAVTAIKLTAI